MVSVNSSYRSAYSRYTYPFYYDTYPVLYRYETGCDAIDGVLLELLMLMADRMLEYNPSDAFANPARRRRMFGLPVCLSSLCKSQRRSMKTATVSGLERPT